MQIIIDNATVTIEGNIKSVDDFQQIKTHIDPLIKLHNSIVIHIPDSLSITSSVIGYFMKLIHKEGIHLTLKVGDERLFNLLEDLNLINEFNVTRA